MNTTYVRTGLKTGLKSIFSGFLSMLISYGVLMFIVLSTAPQTFKYVAIPVSLHLAMRLASMTFGAIVAFCSVMFSGQRV